MIDGPPVLGFADAPLLASAVIGVVFVLEAHGTRRRLQALVAIGYSQSYLADRLGIHAGNFGTMFHHRGQVTVATARAVADLYDELSMTPRVGTDQRTKIKGMFVDPKQIAELVRRHPAIGKARLAVTRDGERDAMTLHVEPAAGASIDSAAIAASLRDITKLGGAVAVADAGSLPNDGKIISDERDYSR